MFLLVKVVVKVKSDNLDSVAVSFLGNSKSTLALAMQKGAVSPSQSTALISFGE